MGFAILVRWHLYIESGPCRHFKIKTLPTHHLRDPITKIWLSYLYMEECIGMGPMSLRHMKTRMVYGYIAIKEDIWVILSLLFSLSSPMELLSSHWWVAEKHDAWNFIKATVCHVHIHHRELSYHVSASGLSPLWIMESVQSYSSESYIFMLLILINKIECVRDWYWHCYDLWK